MATYVRAFLKVGLIGGVVLAFAMTANLAGTDNELQSLGLWILVFGFVITGAYAAREGGQAELRRAMRTGALAGVVAGLVIGMVLIALAIVTALGPGIDRFTEQALSGVTAEQLARLNNDPVKARQIVREAMPLTLSLLAALVALMMPILGALLGLLGGRMAPGIFQFAAQSSDGKTKR